MSSFHSEGSQKNSSSSSSFSFEGEYESRKEEILMKRKRLREMMNELTQEEERIDIQKKVSENFKKRKPKRHFNP
jgi:hypothetical protein